MPLPTGAKLNNTWLDVSVVTDSSVGYKMGVFYGLTGYVIEIEDPGTQTTLNEIWDRMVSKEDSRYGAFLDVDLDDEGVVTEPESQPGGFFDLEELVGTDNRGNLEVFKRRKMITFAQNPTGWDPASGGSYIPTDHFKTHLKGGPKVDTMSYLIFGFSSPAMDFRALSEPVVIPENDWFYLQFLDMFLEEMMKETLGLAASSVSAAAAGAIVQFLEMASWELDDDLLKDKAWQVIAKTTFDVTMPGMQNLTTISTDG